MCGIDIVVSILDAEVSTLITQSAIGSDIEKASKTPDRTARARVAHLGLYSDEP